MTRDKRGSEKSTKIAEMMRSAVQNQSVIQQDRVDLLNPRLSPFIRG